MRKQYILILTLCLMAGGLRSASAATYAQGYLTVTTATTSANYDTTRIGPNVINNSGMTEGPEGTGSKTATQDNTVTNMWMTPNNVDCSLHWIQFDLGVSRILNEMWVWNYNQTGGYNTRGLQYVYIRYKVNATDAWTTLTNAGNAKWQFAMTNPNNVGMPASNLVGTGNPPVSFGGVTARFVQIQPAGGPGVGKYNTADSYCGLSEVRFYGQIGQTQINTTPLSFPVTWVGQSSQTTLDINSIGTANLSVTGLTITGTNASAFSLVSPPTLPASVATGAKLTLTVKFTPSQILTGQTATLNITTNDPYQPSFAIALGGNSVPVELSNFKAE